MAVLFLVVGVGPDSLCPPYAVLKSLLCVAPSTVGDVSPGLLGDGLSGKGLQAFMLELSAKARARMFFP